MPETTAALSTETKQKTSIANFSPPSLREADAWEGEAERETVVTAVALVFSTMGAGAGGDTGEQKRTVQMVAARGYSEAELKYAAQELLYDSTIDWKMRNDKPITAADFERIVAQHRSMRRKLELLLHPSQMNKLVENFPRLLSAEDFGIGGYDADNQPLFRYKADPSTRTADSTPRIYEDNRPGADRQRNEDGHEPAALGTSEEILNAVTEDQKSNE